MKDLSSDEENDRAGPSHIYEFEGTDYANEPSKSDEKAFNELLLGTMLYLTMGLLKITSQKILSVFIFVG